MGLAQLLAILAVGADLEPVGGEEAMAAGTIAEAQPGDVDLAGHADSAVGLGGALAGGDGEPAFQHLAVEQRDDGVQRPHPAEGGIRPTHGFRPGQLADHRFHQLRQHLGGGPARLLDHREPEFALAGVALLALVEAGETGGFQEALNRLLRGADPRPALFLADIGLGQGQAVDDQRQPARRRLHAGRGEGQPRRPQLLGGQALEVFSRAGLHTGGNVFGKQFDEKLGHCTVLPTRPVICRAGRAAGSFLPCG